MDSAGNILQGSNQQKVGQLLSLLQNRQLSPEQLDQLIPHTKEFLEELTTVIKRQTESDKSNYDKIIDASFQIIDSLLLSMKEAPTESERLQFLSTINQIHARMAEIQRNEKDNNRKTITIFGILGTIVMVILTILTAGLFTSSDKNNN